MWIDGRRTLKTKKGKHKATTSTKISSESVLSFLATILKSSSDDESHQLSYGHIVLQTENPAFDIALDFIIIFSFEIIRVHNQNRLASPFFLFCRKTWSQRILVVWQFAVYQHCCFRQPCTQFQGTQPSVPIFTDRDTGTCRSWAAGVI